MSPATRIERPTPPSEPPAAAILRAAQAVCEVRGIHHLVDGLEALIEELTEPVDNSERRRS